MTVHVSNFARNASEDDARAIEELTRQWIEAVQAKNIGRLLSLVTDDVVFLPPVGPPIKGKTAVGDLYRSLFAQFDLEQTASADEIEVNGDWAFSWGAERLKLSPCDGGQPIRLSGKGMTILRRQTDGSWIFARGINNSSPEAAARSG